MAEQQTSSERAASVEKLIQGIQKKNDDARAEAVRAAAGIGEAAIAPLAALTADPDAEVRRSAKRAMWHVVRSCGRPGAEAQRQAVSAALVPLLTDEQPAALRRDVVWMLSEVGEDACVAPVAALLTNGELREDARMALERIPGAASLDALRAAFATAPEDFKSNLAESLRNRGETIEGYPSTKMKPVKATAVTPL